MVFFEMNAQLFKWRWCSLFSFLFPLLFHSFRWFFSLLHFAAVCHCSVFAIVVLIFLFLFFEIFLRLSTRFAIEGVPKERKRQSNIKIKCKNKERNIVTEKIEEKSTMIANRRDALTHFPFTFPFLFIFGRFVVVAFVFFSSSHSSFA